MMKTNKTVFLLGLLLSVCTGHLSYTYEGDIPPVPALPFANNSSPEEMDRMMMQDIEQTAKEIDAFVKTLPPKEQEEFNRVVKVVEKKMGEADPATLERFLTNQMAPDELDQFLGTMFADIEPAPEQQEEAQPAVTKKEKVKKKPAPEVVSKQDILVATIKEIIKKTDSFIVKTQAIPELTTKVKQWGKSNIIYDWDPSFEWEKVKKDIETLRQQLEKAIDKDPKNNKYKFIDEILKNEALTNNITKIKTALSEYEPQIEVSSFGLSKMTEKARTALQRSLSAFTESLYRVSLPKELENIFKTYEPRAKKLRDECENAEKKAVAECQRVRHPAAALEAGTPHKESYHGGGFYEGPYVGGGWDGSQSYHTPSYESYSASRNERSPSRSNGPSASSGSGNRASSSKHGLSNEIESQLTKEGDENQPKTKGAQHKTNLGKNSPSSSKKESAVSDKTKKQKDGTAEEERPKIKKLLSSLEKALESANEIIKDNDILKGKESLKVALTSAGEPEDNVGVALREIQLFLNQAVRHTQSLHRELHAYTPTDRARIRNKTLDIIEKALPDYKGIVTQINEAREELDKQRTASSITIPAEKRYAYFADQSAIPQTVSNAQARLGTEISLSETTATEAQEMHPLRKKSSIWPVNVVDIPHAVEKLRDTASNLINAAVSSLKEKNADIAKEI